MGGGEGVEGGARGGGGGGTVVSQSQSVVLHVSFH